MTAIYLDTQACNLISLNQAFWVVDEEIKAPKKYLADLL